MSELQKERCPLCGGPNGCGMAAGSAKCWCFSTPVSKAALARVPEAARDQVCICRACASDKPSPTKIAEQLGELLRKR